MNKKYANLDWRFPTSKICLKQAIFCTLLPYRTKNPDVIGANKKFTAFRLFLLHEKCD